MSMRLFGKLPRSCMTRIFSVVMDRGRPRGRFQVGRRVALIITPVPALPADWLGDEPVS